MLRRRHYSAEANAYDMILLVRSCDDRDHPGGIVDVSCSEAIHCFGSTAAELLDSNKRFSVHFLVVSTVTGETLCFPIRNNFIHSFEEEKNFDENVDTSKGGSSGIRSAPSAHRHCTDALRQIANSLPLGKNRARFLLLEQHGGDDDNDGNGEPMIVGIAPFHIFVWSSTLKDFPALVVVDVDGTVTRTSKRGFWHTAIVQDFSHKHCHAGVCPLLTVHSKNKNVVYLTSRPLSYADATRKFLESLREGSHGLPPGPVLGYTGTVAGVLRMDHWDRNPHVVKYDILERNVLRPFRELGVVTHSLLEAGFGNTLYDMHVYHKAGIALHRLFLVDKQSRIFCLDRNSSTVNGWDCKGHASSDGVKGCENHRALNHPRDYAMETGTLFQRGYEDENLWRYILGYNKP